MLTQQTVDDFDIVGYLATEFEYAPYLVLAALLLWALFLTLRTRKPAPSLKPVDVDEPEKIETDEQLAAPAAPASRKRYVDADARTILAPREATLATVAVAAADELVAARQTAHQVRKVADRPEPFYDSLGFGVFFLTGSFAAMAFLLGWEFPGVEAVFNFTTAGWWMVGILFALTIPAIVRIARRQEGTERFFTAAAGLAGSAAITAAAISFLGLGIASTPFAAVWTHAEPQRQTIVSTETIVPSSLSFQSGRYEFLLGGTASTVSGLVETDDGIRTFAASSYRYGDEWQLVTEKTCVTTVYASPLIVQDAVDDEQCVTQTTAVLGSELPAH